ncbi:hypothetical protein KKE45_02325 [Patescibacteria group bacterium]|nr:hypothetical protein [Patescibacteria group bacterium]
MAGNKLIKQLKEEIEKYIGIPYWRNHWSNLTLLKEGPFGGKGTWQQINYATKCATQKENKKNKRQRSPPLAELNTQQIYNLRKRNHIGIDCSGLCYHLLDKLDKLKGNHGILFKTTGVDKPFGVLGVNKVSASELTHPQNSTKIADYNNIQTGDLIRFDKGKHVIFIIEKKRNTIYYIHSSDKTKTRGVHYGTIKITNPNKSLNYQQWSDQTLKGNNYYSKFFFPNSSDGVFRLNCWL